MVKTPPYIQLANELRRDILQGKYGTEGGLPGIEHLIKTSGLARGTVYRSLTLLQGEGLIKERDRTFYVNKSSIMMTQHVPPPRVRLQAVGKIAFMRNLAPVAIVPLPDDIAKLLELGQEVTATFRYRISGELVDGKEIPARLLKYHYLIPLTDEQIQRMQDDPHTDVLLELYPVPMIRHDDISSRLPTKEEAQHLAIPETTPVLGVRVVNRDVDGNVLLVQELALANTTLSYEYTFDNRPKQ
jgi:DNA-binding GntR family transcriptional regulator